MQTTTTEILCSKECMSDGYAKRVRQNKHTPRKWTKNMLRLRQFRKTIATTMEIQRWDMWFSQQCWLRNHTDVSEELAASSFGIWVVQGEYKSLRFGSCDICLLRQFKSHLHKFLVKWNNCGWWPLLENVRESTNKKHPHLQEKLVIIQ